MGDVVKQGDRDEGERLDLRWQVGVDISQIRRMPQDAAMAANPSSKPAAVGGKLPGQRPGGLGGRATRRSLLDFVRGGRSLADEPKSDGCNVVACG